MPDSLTFNTERDLTPSLITPAKSGINGVHYGVNELLVSSIHIPANRLRSASDDAVLALAQSIDELGLRNPIVVRPGDSPNDFVLVAGLHRLEAFRFLNRDFIPAHVRDLSGKAARLEEIAENLQRSELTFVQRDEQIAEYARLIREAMGEEDEGPAVEAETVIPQAAEEVSEAPKAAHRPVDPTSNVQVAKELGITEDRLRRAELSANITPGAKQAIIDAGLKDTQAVRMEIAKEPPEKQADKVKEIARKPRRVTVTPTHPSASEGPTTPATIASLPPSAPTQPAPVSSLARIIAEREAFGAGSPEDDLANPEFCMTFKIGRSVRKILTLPTFLGFTRRHWLHAGVTENNDTPYDVEVEGPYPHADLIDLCGMAAIVRKWRLASKPDHLGLYPYYWNMMPGDSKQYLDSHPEFAAELATRQAERLEGYWMNVSEPPMLYSREPEDDGKTQWERDVEEQAAAAAEAAEKAAAAAAGFLDNVTRYRNHMMSVERAAARAAGKTLKQYRAGLEAATPATPDKMAAD